MKRTSLLLTLWASAVSPSLLLGADCDQPLPTGCSSGRCMPAEDGGLLDVVDQFAGRIHADIRRLLHPVQAGLKQQFASNCDAGCDTWTEVDSHESHPSTAARPAQRHTGGAGSSRSVTFGETPDWGHSWTTQSGESNGNSRPTQLRQTPATPSNSDSQVNPFADEPQTSQRPVRGRTIQYQRTPSKPAYGQRYNSQASNTTSTADYWTPKNIDPSGRPILVTTVADEFESRDHLPAAGQPISLVRLQPQRLSQAPTYDNPLRPNGATR
ncbi:MAG: hypothetical protein KF752_17910 [Pirellulaceae bacterium]|nr:hypothetical protein [Pirellulaceae bacterium]